MAGHNATTHSNNIKSNYIQLKLHLTQHKRQYTGSLIQTGAYQDGFNTGLHGHNLKRFRGSLYTFKTNATTLRSLAQDMDVTSRRPLALSSMVYPNKTEPLHKLSRRTVLAVTTSSHLE